MLGLPLICVVQISGTLVEKHAHGCLTDEELLLKVLPCNLDKLLVAVSVKTKLWSNEVKLKERRRLLLPALNPLLHRVAVLDHSHWLLHNNLQVQEFPGWTCPIQDVPTQLCMVSLEQITKEFEKLPSEHSILLRLEVLVVLELC